jgi:hypothetical protein
MLRQALIPLLFRILHRHHGLATAQSLESSNGVAQRDPHPIQESGKKDLLVPGKFRALDNYGRHGVFGAE